MFEQPFTVSIQDGQAHWLATHWLNESHTKEIFLASQGALVNQMHKLKDSINANGLQDNPSHPLTQEELLKAHPCSSRGAWKLPLRSSG